MWWWNDYKLTTQHGTDRTSNKTGNGMLNPGFHACVDWQPTYEPVVAFANYKFIFHFPSPMYGKVVFLDIRDADYSYGYSVPDLDLRWNNSEGYFEYRNSATNDQWEKLCDNWDSVKIWVLFGISDGDENKGRFQLTPPRNFHCTNPSQTDHNPHFEWNMPLHPEETTFFYNMYRDTGSGYVKINQNPITDTSYTDTGIIINKTGSNTVYY